jgi:rare lipoprotein A
MILPRRLSAALLFVFLAIMAGCSGPSGKRAGGYYKDDGPGSSVPANIHAIPNAVPRIENHARANFKPYVVFGKRYTPISDNQAFRQEGTASWYGRKFHGNKTANGEIYDMYAMTAAHPTLPIPSYARVTHARTRKSVIVRVNDRGPFHSSRIIDLSYVAAAKLDLIGPGSGQVIVEAITNEDIRSNAYARAPGSPPASPPSPLAQETAPRAMHIEPAPDVPDALAALGGDAFSRPIITDEGRRMPSSASTSQDLLYRPGNDQAQERAPIAATRPAMAAATDNVYLQFGAFSALHSADHVAQDLNRQIGHVESRSAHVQRADELYRVQIGPYPTRTAAVNAALRIQQQTGLQGAVAIR